MWAYHSRELDQLDFGKTLKCLRIGAVDIALEGTASIAEAEILRCAYKGKRFNIKFDLVYGVSIDAIDGLSERDFGEILILLLCQTIESDTDLSLQSITGATPLARHPFRNPTPTGEKQCIQ